MISNPLKDRTGTRFDEPADRSEACPANMSFRNPLDGTRGNTLDERKRDSLIMTIIPTNNSDFFAEFPQPKGEIVEGLFRPGQLVVLGGAFGLGKTPLLQDWIVHLVHGLSWCDRRVSQRHVILLDLESNSDLYRESMLRISQRLGVRPPSPGQWIPYFEHASASSLGTKVLLDVLRKSRDKKFEFLKLELTKHPDTIVIIDPFDMFFQVDMCKAVDVMKVYSELRLLLAQFPESCFLLVCNLRKRDRKHGSPSLLSDARDWLEEIGGSIAILARADVRLGFAEYDRDLRILNGIRRGEECFPMLLRTVGDTPNLAGYEQVPPDDVVLRAKFTEAEGKYWGVLPNEFVFSEVVAAGTVPKSTLSRLTHKALALNAMVQDADGTFRKILGTVPSGAQ